MRLNLEHDQKKTGFRGMWNRRRAKSKKKAVRQENFYAYLLLLPWLIGFIGLSLGPMLASLWLSFTDFDLLSSPQWVGLDNYVTMFTNDIRYFSAVKVTLIYAIVAVPLQLALALLVAMVLNRSLIGLGLYRSVYYLPSLMAGSVAIAIVWRQIFGNEGVINILLEVIGIDGPSWLVDPSTAVIPLIMLRVWQFGTPMVIFLAGLKQIPQNLYEASAVDGANSRSQFFHITLPLLTPIIFFNLVLNLINAFQSFTPAFILTNGSGGTLDSLLIYTLYLYKQGFGQLNMGYASAMAWLLLVTIALFTAVNFALSRYWVFYEND